MLRHTEQVNNFYGSGLLATGFIAQGDDYTKTIGSEGSNFFDTDNYTVGIATVTQSTDGEAVVRTLGNIASTSALISDTTSNESVSALNTTDGVFASFVDGSSTYQIITDDGASLVVGQGTPRSVIVPVFDNSSVTDPLTGLVASGIKGTWFFPNSVTPSYGTSLRSINRKTQDIDQRLTILELNAGASANQIDASSGLFNVLDGGAGNDHLSVAGGSSLIPVPGGGFLSQQGAPGSLLYGNAGDDALNGSSRGDVLIGGTGNDILKGHGGNDRYIIFAGDGSDIIFDDGTVSSVREQDVIQLPASVSAGDLVVSWGEELVASRTTESNWIGELQSLHAVLNISWGTSDTLTVVIPHTDLNSGLGIDTVEFADGSRLAFQTLIAQAGQQPDFDVYKQNNVLTGAGQIFGGAGDDVVNGISVDTGSSNGRPGPIEGDTSSLYDPDISRLVGGAGFDQLFGGDGKDELLGGNIYHSEIIVIDGVGTYAFSGLWSEGDFYKGGKADDTLWLTAGSDVIEYGPGDGNDRVTDFYHSTVGEAFGGVGSQALADASIENGWDDLGIVELVHQQMLVSNHDTLRFGTGISASDIKVERIALATRATEPENDTLSFSLRDGSGRVAFERWFTAAHNQLNRVEFADGTVWEGAVLESLINGEALNNAPVVNIALPDQTSDEDAIFSYQIPGTTFTDVDANDSLTLSAALADDSALPSWISFDAGTKTLSGTPGNDDVGSYAIKVLATDSEGLSVADTFTLTIANVNDAPELTTGIADQQVDEDSAFDFILPANTFTDIDLGDNLNVSATLVDGSTLPAWLNFDVGNQTFSGTPGNSDVGLVSVLVSATDSAGASVSDQFDIDVLNTNDAPVVIGSVEDKVLLSGDNFSFTLPENLFTDVDIGDALSYSLSMADGAPLPNWLSFDSQTLLLRGVPPESATGFDELILVATDQEGLSAAVPFNLTYSQPQSSSSVASYYFESFGFQFGSSQGEALFGQSGVDYLYGVAGDNALYGMAGNDVLSGGPDNDFLKGGTGNDRLYGVSGDDLYLFNPGGGHDTVFDLVGDDSLIFGAGIDKEDLWFSRSGYDLLIDTVGDDDHVNVQNWYLSESFQIEEISTAAGSILHNNQVDQLVQAMASFSRPVGGVLNLSPEEQSQLEPVIAATWQ